MISVLSIPPFKDPQPIGGEMSPGVKNKEREMPRAFEVGIKIVKNTTFREGEA